MNKMLIFTLLAFTLLSCGGGKKEKKAHSNHAPNFEQNTSASESTQSSTDTAQQQEDYNPDVTSLASVKVFSFFNRKNFKFCHLSMASGNNAEVAVREAAHLRCMDEMGTEEHLNFGDDSSFQTDNAVTNFTQMLASILPVARHFSIGLVNCSDTYTESTFNELTTRQEKNCYFKHMQPYTIDQNILSEENALSLQTYFASNTFEFCQVAFYSGNDEEREMPNDVSLQCSNPESSPEAFVFQGQSIDELRRPSIFDNFTKIMGQLIPAVEKNGMQLMNCADAESSSSRNLITFTADRICYFIRK